MTNLSVHIESAIGGLGAEIQILRSQADDIRSATSIIRQAVTDYLGKFDELKNKFGNLSTKNLVDFKIGLNTISEDDELKKIDAKIQKLKDLQSVAGKFGGGKLEIHGMVCGQTSTNTEAIG